MNKKLVRRSLLAAALLLPSGRARCGGFFPKDPFTDSARGTVAAQFLKVPPSARWAALGSAGLALSGPDAFFLNPAGLAAGAGSAFSASYEALPADSSRTGLLFSGSTGAGVFSAGLLYNNSGAGLEKLDGAGNGAGIDLTAYDAAFGAGWARSAGLTDFGFSLKYIRSRLAEVSGNSFALDGGVIFRAGPGDTTDLTLAFRNFGPPLKLGSEAAPLPFEAAGGLKWKYSPILDILVEGRLPVDHASYLILAGEWFIPFQASPGGGTRRPGFFFRSGLNFRNYGDHGLMGAYAGGFGFRAGGLSFDYAFSPYGVLGSAHGLTAGWAWGGAKAVYKAAAGQPGKERLAVAAFSRGGAAAAAEADAVRGLVETELAKTGKFLLAERGPAFVLKEKKLAASGLPAEMQAAELGRFSQASSAVFGLVYKDKNGYVITVRLVDPVSGEILRSESAQARQDYFFSDAARRLAAALAK